MPDVDNELYLCLDQGGHASRAALIDKFGTIQHVAYRDIATQRDGVRVEHDPQELHESLQAAAAEVVAAAGSDAARITAAGLATQRSSIVCWDRVDRSPLSPVLSWQDRRAADWLQKYSADEKQVHAITGLVLSPHYGVSKLRWCMDNIPEVSDALVENRLGFGPLASWLASRLGGADAVYADPANASRTLLWDRRSRDWSVELLALFDVPAACLPLSVTTCFDWGEIDCAGHRIPLRVVTGDQSAALFAFGEPEPDVVYANLGTGAFLQRSMSDPDADSGNLLASVVYQENNEVISILEATVNGAGAAINELAAELDLDLEYVKEHSAGWLEQSAGPVLFINAVSGLGSPWWLPETESRFEGDGSPEEKMAAVLESIAFLIAVNIEAGNQLAGNACARIVVTGGLGSVDPLLQRIADLTGATVVRAEISEATARGLAYLVTGRPAEWPKVHAAKVFAPQVDKSLANRYQRWLSLMPALS